MNPFRTRAAGLTDVGHVRRVNEDSLLLRDDVGVWLVADGMGGYESGDWASQLIAARVAACEPGADFAVNLEILGRALQAANAEVFAESQARGRPLGSTAVLLHLCEGRFGLLWAGDSRGYLLRAGVMHRISRDHTQVQAMVDDGLLTPEAATTHPMAHVLSRAVGSEAVLRFDLNAARAHPRDVFLLCSDGLTGLLSDSEIAAGLEGQGVEAACQRLVGLALARGAPDNVTVVAVACEETTVFYTSSTEARADP